MDVRKGQKLLIRFYDVRDLLGTMATAAALARSSMSRAS